MFGVSLPSVEIAGLTIGVREAVLALIVLVALYIGITLWRMRRLASRPPASNPQPAPAVPPAAEAPPTEVPPAPAAAEYAAFAPTPSRLADEPLDAGLAGELAQLRDEVDAIRGELAALRGDMLEELAQLRASQAVSPIYGDAMQMAVAGYEAAMIAERCGIARAEAELVVALARSQRQ